MPKQKRKHKKIKICFISTKAYPLFNQSVDEVHGGAEIQLYLWSTELAKDPIFDVSFVVGDFGQAKTEKIEGVTIFKSANILKKDNFLIKSSQAIAYYRLMKKIDADLYVTTAVNSLKAVVSFFCKINGKKHLYRTAHTGAVDLSCIKNKGIQGFLYKYGLENADFVVTQAEEHRELLRQNHNMESTVIRNSFRLNQQKNTFAKEYTLWVARYCKWKNPDLFIKIVKKLPAEKFIMICPVNIKGNSEYENFVKKVKKIKNLLFIEQVLFHEIQQYFDKAKLFINTSDYEGFPNTFIQAGIGFTPVVSLNVDPDSFITLNNCGYYADGNFPEMINQIKILLANPTLRKKLGDNISRYIAQYNDIGKNIRVLKKLILEKME